MHNEGIRQPLPATAPPPQRPRLRRRLQRISRQASPLVGLLAVLTAGAILFVEASAPAGTFALFGAGTNNPSSFAAVAVYAPPSNPTATAVDTSVNLGWPAAQPNNNGNGNGYAVSGLNIQPPTVAAPNCAAQTYGTSTWRAGVAPTSPNVAYTDVLSALPPASTVQNYAGSWSCWQVLTGYSTTAPAGWTQVPGITGAGTQGWYSVQNPRTAGTRIGFFADVAHLPAANPAVVSNTFVVHYNQATNQPAIPAGDGVCLSTTFGIPFIYLAQPNATSCQNFFAPGTISLGRLFGGTLATSGVSDHINATFTWTDSQTMTVTITNLNGNVVTIGGNWIFAPEPNSVLTADTTVPVCAPILFQAPTQSCWPPNT